jgi:thymidylate synthase
MKMTGIPTLSIVGQNLPDCWERSLKLLWDDGCNMPTQYDAPNDPNSRDAIMTIRIEDPLSEPRLHRCLPGGFIDHFKYVDEVVLGSHNHLVNMDPESTVWKYTYNQRFFGYPGFKFVSGHNEGYEWVPDEWVPHKINQIASMIDSLVAAPHTRRALAITWDPDTDNTLGDPPCLQQAWMRIIEDSLQSIFTIRSNDAWKAALMNMYAFIELTKSIAQILSERLDREIKVGPYQHVAYSYHIYGSYFEDFKQFLESCKNRTWPNRTYRSDDPDVIEARKEATMLTEYEMTFPEVKIVGDVRRIPRDLRERYEQTGSFK